MIKRYHAPATPYERALTHPKLSNAIKRRLRETYRSLDPVALLAEIHRCQAELGERIARRGLAAAADVGPADPLAFVAVTHSKRLKIASHQMPSFKGIFYLLGACSD